MGFIGWHDELDVGAGFVEEVPDRGAGDDVCCCWAAADYGGGYDGHAAVAFEFLGGDQAENSSGCKEEKEHDLPRRRHLAFFGGRRNSLCLR